MNKREVVNQIIQKLTDEFELYRRAALAARAEATDEQSNAEHKYDTRGLEASYLARGQSKQAAEIDVAIAEFQNLDLKEFSPDDPIKVGALVQLQKDKQRDTYFIGPKGGGTEIEFEGQDIMVITPQSPLGEQLAGRKQGEKCVLELAGQKQQFTISSVL